MTVFRIVGHHRQHARRRPELEANTQRLLFEEIEGEAHSAVFRVSDVQDAAGDEGISRFALRVAGVHVRRYREGFLVQLRHHDVLVDARGEDEPQAAFVCRHFKVGLGVPEQVGQVVVQSVLYGQCVQRLSLKIISTKVPQTQTLHLNLKFFSYQCLLSIVD